ncbi:hypothetical protein FKM82_017727 [Ascaphus truei]
MDFSRKRKRSRWNDETPDQKTIIPGMPTVIPPGLSREQERAYIGNFHSSHCPDLLHLLSPFIKNVYLDEQDFKWVFECPNTVFQLFLPANETVLY